MARKLRRQAEMFTSRMLPHWMLARDREPLGTGAVSFTRVLGRPRSRVIKTTKLEATQLQVRILNEAKCFRAPQCQG
jgi:hypothetical protein